MPSIPTYRISQIVHAQAVRLPGHDASSVQIDGIDQDGKSVRIILEPPVLKMVIASLVQQNIAHGDAGLSRPA